MNDMTSVLVGMLLQKHAESVRDAIREIGEGLPDDFVVKPTAFTGVHYPILDPLYNLADSLEGDAARLCGDI